MSETIWILGATGRSGRSIAEGLHAMGHTLVLAGRDPSRLHPLAERLGGAGIASGSFESLLTQLHEAAPTVVVNTVGPFARTTGPVIEACPPGTHYVDLANELPAVVRALDQHDRATDRGSTIVTGAGFGVLATESLVVRMRATWPAPVRVRVDAIPSLAVQDGVIGAALAGSIIDGLPEGGWQVAGGRLARSALSGQAQRLTTPNGDPVSTAALPSGDLVAAWRASSAPTVVSASSMAPSGPAVRLVLPAAVLLSRAGVLRRLAVNRLAGVRLRAAAMPREFSWGHCSMGWADGSRREAWLRIGDAQEFTTAATTEIARRLATQDVRAGAYTPAALFGPSLAEDLGATYVE